MRPLPFLAARSCALALCLAVSIPAWAQSTVLSGMFDGTEPSITPLSANEPCHDELPYQQVTFRVSRDGSYLLDNALENLFEYGAGGVGFYVYEDSFNPAAPEHNLLVPENDPYFRLKAGKPYVVVIQPGCGLRNVAWAIWLLGSGSVISDHVAAVPSFTKGTFSPGDPLVASDCSSGVATAHHVSGPIRVSRSGSYYFSDSSWRYGVQVCLQIFSAPFDRHAPAANLLGAVTFGRSRIDLQEGRDYYFVTQSVGWRQYGDFHFALAPPAPFRINPTLAGSWYNPETPGQGFFLSLYENRNQAFLGWFTYASDHAADDEFAHRWITATGNYSGNTGELAIDWSVGGTFDANGPPPEYFRDGTIELEFQDCNSGQIRYDWVGDGAGRAGASGVIPIRRIARDSVNQCESLQLGPGKLGPL